MSLMRRPSGALGHPLRIETPASSLIVLSNSSFFQLGKEAMAAMELKPWAFSHWTPPSKHQFAESGT